MRTTKPISTISFNSAEFLITKLNELIPKVISFYAVIKHLPEDDEGGKKEHFHVYIEPSRMVQTEDLRAQFKEFDFAMPDKPKGTLSFNNSKFPDWYLYALHDADYLASKGQSRKYHYQPEEVLSNDADDLNAKIHSIDFTASVPLTRLRKAISEGFSFADICASGIVPIAQIRQYKEMYFVLSNYGEQTYRNNKTPHAMDTEVSEDFEAFPDAKEDDGRGCYYQSEFWDK